MTGHGFGPLVRGCCRTSHPLVPLLLAHVGDLCFIHVRQPAHEEEAVALLLVRHFEGLERLEKVKIALLGRRARTEITAACLAE